MKQRIVTGVAAGAGFLALLWLGGQWFTGLMILAALVAYDEFVRMIGMRRNIVTWMIGLIGLIALAAPWGWTGIAEKLPIESAVWLLLFALLVVTVVSKNRVAIDQAGLLLTGVMYISLGYHYILETRLLPENGLFWTSLVLICIWVTDSGAYFTGYAFGKHKLWPTISPKKTVEGALGGIVLAIAAALVFAWARPELLGIGQAILLGAVIAVVGQMGDLIQSAYKRAKGVKDSGTLLPGHGGVLDRTDSWIIVFPFVYLLDLIPH